MAPIQTERGRGHAGPNFLDRKPTRPTAGPMGWVCRTGSAILERSNISSLTDILA